MPFELQSFAQRHFGKPTHQSLVAAIRETLDPAILLDVLSSGSCQLQALAAERLRHLDADRNLQSILQSGLRRSATRESMLEALSWLSLQYDRETIDLICEQLDATDPSVVEAAAKAIVFQLPELIDTELVPRLDRPEGKRIARPLCFSARAGLIPRLADRYGFPARRLPPVIGFLVSPEWLAENHGVSPQLVENLAEECGYSEGVSLADAADFWSQGFMFAGPQMVSAGIPLQKLRSRVFGLCYRLLPFDVEAEQRSACGFDAENPLDLELFLAALREADRTNLDLARKRAPFDNRRRASPRIVACSHASVRFVRHQFVARAQKLAEELNVPRHHGSTFLLEHGRAGLEIDDERQTEADLYLRSRWYVISRNPRFAQTLPPISFPVHDVDDFPWGLENWAGRPISPWKHDPGLTAGANAGCRLANHLGRFELAEWIREKEIFWRGKLPPIGCEVQIPLGDRTTSLLKKQVLRRLGIPSPRRPEYRAMVEAAFRPSASWHAMLAGPILLAALGIIDQPQEMALHISVQGDVGSDIRFLAVCATFIHTGRRKRPHYALTRVMSKGLVCRNTDVEECLPDVNADCRTEIRLHRCYAKSEDDGPILVEPSYVDDILATHLLATAAMSDRQALHDIYAAFSTDVDAAIARLPSEFAEYLQADFFQCTGNPHDPQLLDVVPIVEKLTAVRETVRKTDLRDELEGTFLGIRDRAAWKVLRHLAGSESAALSEWNPDQYPHAVICSG